MKYLSRVKLSVLYGLLFISLIISKDSRGDQNFVNTCDCYCPCLYKTSMNKENESENKKLLEKKKQFLRILL